MVHSDILFNNNTMHSPAQSSTSFAQLFNIDPKLGPRIVFFTGGTALKNLSQELCKYTHNSVHLVTPFDSGGSSATLRAAFGMPAVGDARNRLLALANLEYIPQSVIELCEWRLKSHGTRAELLETLYALASTKHAVWDHMPRLFAEPLRVYLRYFLEKMPDSFNPQQACIGNLIIAGGYLHHRRQWGPILSQISRLLQARGIVLPITTKSLHLAADLVDGSRIVGQHCITGYGRPGPHSAVQRLFLLTHDKKQQGPSNEECIPRVQLTAATYIRTADAICYPMGSFYTSVLANLLPKGVGKSIIEAQCPKFYIPNVGHDVEQRTVSVAHAIAIILKTLRADAGDVSASKLLHKVLIDTKHGFYPSGIDKEGIEAQGVKVCDMPLLAKAHIHDARLTAKAVMSQVTTS